LFIRISAVYFNISKWFSNKHTENIVFLFYFFLKSFYVPDKKNNQSDGFSFMINGIKFLKQDLMCTPYMLGG